MRETVGSTSHACGVSSIFVGFFHFVFFCQRLTNKSQSHSSSSSFGKIYCFPFYSFLHRISNEIIVYGLRTVQMWRERDVWSSQTQTPLIWNMTVIQKSDNTCQSFRILFILLPFFRRLESFDFDCDCRRGKSVSKKWLTNQWTFNIFRAILKFNSGVVSGALNLIT